MGASLWVASCTVDTLPAKREGATRDSQAADSGTSPDDRAHAADIGPVTRGAGMPIVPIHRDDAGSSSEVDAATSVPTAPVATGRVDASQLDAAHDAAPPPPEPARDAGGSAMPDEQASPQPLHRYTFTGTSLEIPDELGEQVALVEGNAQLDGQGAVTFPGGGDGVVKLPDDLLSDVTDFTLLVWLEARSEACWQRAIDLLHVQSTPNGMGSPSSELISLYLTPFGCPDALPTVGYVNATSKFHLTGQTKLKLSEQVQLGLSYSSRSRTLRLIVDGEVLKEQTVPVDLHALQRASGWLGRSHFESDPQLNGAITELRVYASELDARALRELFARGPDAP